MMGVIVIVCAASGLIVSEAKTEIMCLHTKRIRKSTATFSVGAAGQVYNQMNEFVYLGENVNYNVDLTIGVNRRIHNGAASRSLPSNFTTDRAPPSSSKFGC